MALSNPGQRGHENAVRARHSAHYVECYTVQLHLKPTAIDSPYP